MRGRLSGKAGLLRGKKGARPRWEKERGERAGLMRELVGCRPVREERAGRREKWVGPETGFGFWWAAGWVSFPFLFPISTKLNLFEFRFEFEFKPHSIK